MRFGNFQTVSAYSEMAFQNGKKVKDVEVVEQNNNGIVRQIVRDNMTRYSRSLSRRRDNHSHSRSRRVRFADVSKRGSPSELGISFRRMPTPYFTRKQRKVKGLRKYGKKPK